MKSTRIGLVMMNDERPHVYRENESVNMEVLRKWASLLEKECSAVDGSAPEIVVASETVKSIPVARKIAAEFTRQDCRQVIMCYNVWNFPFLVWPFIENLRPSLPILSLSNNNGKFPGNVGLLASDGALRQAGIRTHRIVGNMDDPAVLSAVIDWLWAAQASTCLRGSVYGCYGGHSMGMETGYFHLVPALQSFGCTLSQIDQLLLVKEMETILDTEVEKGFLWFTQLLQDRILYDGKMLTEDTLKTQIRLYLAMKKVNEEYGFDFCGLKGQRELTEHVCLGDIPEMLMNDPYDWNGPKEPMVCATEADAFAAITMEILKYASAGLPTLFMDVRLYHPDLDLWDLCNSGNHASYYATRTCNPEENYKKITFHPALEFYFKAGGASVEFTAAAGPITFARLGIWNGKPFLVVIPGEALDLPIDQQNRINAETDPTWPHVHARFNASFDQFLKIFPANHLQGVAGKYEERLRYFAEINNIPMILLKKGKDIPQIWELVKG
ncbi:MAG: hypothetical protein WDA18_01530 [Candidatus Ratteibacteria bacterium]